MNDSKRPNHPDFMVTSELKNIEFSGLRNNSLDGSVEIWVLGEIKKTLSRAILALNPRAIEEAMQEEFGIDDVRRRT